MENNVAKKAIETIDLLHLVDINQIKGFDVKPFLFNGLIIKEADFRAQLKAFNYKDINNAKLYVYCSSDAIIPMWAYMLVASHLTENNIPFTFAANMETAFNQFLFNAVEELNVETYMNKRVVVKGCGQKINVSPAIYMLLAHRLKHVVKALSFGEACSMVPLYKN
ncbi:MAG: DUF2480 family protein [Chitinophagales bacterium]|nr:DUF2480 family protein [Chitinophagales bacterium]